MFVFGPGVDRIRVLAWAGPDIGSWLQGAFRADAAGRARDQSDRILYDTDSGRLFYHADGNLAGGKAAVLIAQFGTLPDLGRQDFLLV